MSVIDFFGDIEKEDIIWLVIAYVVFAAPAFSIGLTQKEAWLWIIAVVVTVIFVAFLFAVYLSKNEIKRREVKILASAPDFPHQEYCDSCGKSLEGAEERIEGDLRILICPHCNAENILKGR